jgi:Protein of unknown function (DUF3159)
MSESTSGSGPAPGTDAGRQPGSTGVGPTGGAEPEFRYVEEFVRHQLSVSLGGVRGMVESALPFVAFTVAWVLSRNGTGLPISPLYLSLAAALAAAVILAVVRLLQKQSVKFVVQAVIPTAIAAIVASRTGRAEDIFLPGILYNGALALISAFTIVIRKPLVGFIIGAAIGDPTSWMKDHGLVKMTSKLTAVLAVPYVARFVIQLPLFLGHQVVLLGIAKVVLGWPLLLAALFVIGLLLSKGKTPIEHSVLARRPVSAEAEAEA